MGDTGKKLTLLDVLSHKATNIFVLIISSCIIVWGFVQIRDFPLYYATKADIAVIKNDLTIVKADLIKAVDDAKLDSKSSMKSISDNLELLLKLHLVEATKISDIRNNQKRLQRK